MALKFSSIRNRPRKESREWGIHARSSRLLAWRTPFFPLRHVIRATIHLCLLPTHFVAAMHDKRNTLFYKYEAWYTSYFILQLRSGLHYRHRKRERFFIVNGIWATFWCMSTKYAATNLRMCLLSYGISCKKTRKRIWKTNKQTRKKNRLKVQFNDPPSEQTNATNQPVSQSVVDRSIDQPNNHGSYTSFVKKEDHWSTP